MIRSGPRGQRLVRQSRRSIELQPDGLDDRRPFRELLIEEVARPPGDSESSSGSKPAGDEAMLQVLVSHCGARGLSDPFDNRRRRALRGEEADKILRCEVPGSPAWCTVEIEGAVKSGLALVTARILRLPRIVQLDGLACHASAQAFECAQRSDPSGPALSRDRGRAQSQRRSML